MILIAESGSTKCDWAECSSLGKIIKIHQTVGLNPKFTTEKSMLINLRKSSLLKIKDKVRKIYFYGAGCSSRKKNNFLKSSMQNFFLNAKITIKHDLEAAAIASYKGNPIICSILGTGSNSCFYDGEKIVENGASLGYILGDEASGNYFGKQLINLYVNKRLPKKIVKNLEKWTNEREEEIINNIYSVEKPNLYIASFFPFMYENREQTIFNIIFKNGIQHFFELHIKCFKDYKKYPLTFTGSVAFYLSDYINEIAKKEGMIIQEIIRSPIKNLVSTHFKK